jgi:hypothetical protein
VGAAGRNHREAVLVLVDHAVEQHRPVDVEHFLDRSIQIARLLAADADRMIGLG